MINLLHLHIKSLVRMELVKWKFVRWKFDTIVHTIKNYHLCIATLKFNQDFHIYWFAKKSTTPTYNTFLFNGKGVVGKGVKHKHFNSCWTTELWVISRIHWCLTVHHLSAVVTSLFFGSAHGDSLLAQCWLVLCLFSLRDSL